MRTLLHRPPDDGDDKEEEDNKVEDNDKVEDNNKDDNNFKDISALGLDRDLGFSRENRGYWTHDDDDKSKK